MNKTEFCEQTILDRKRVFTIRSIAKEAKCHRTFAGKVITKLLKQGKIERVGRTKIHKYKVIKDKVETIKEIPSKNLELDYSQIGKAITERIKQLESLVKDSIDLERKVKILVEENQRYIETTNKQRSTIQKLNKRIIELNDQLQRERTNRPTVTETSKFKFSEIARIKP